MYCGGLQHWLATILQEMCCPPNNRADSSKNHSSKNQRNHEPAAYHTTEGTTRFNYTPRDPEREDHHAPFGQEGAEI